MPDTIKIVDPKYWYTSDNPNDNTVKCYQDICYGYPNSQYGYLKLCK